MNSLCSIFIPYWAMLQILACCCKNDELCNFAWITPGPLPTRHHCKCSIQPLHLHYTAFIQTHRNMELYLQSLFGLLCTAVLFGSDPATPPLPPHLGSYTRALLVSQDRRHLFLTPCPNRLGHSLEKAVTLTKTIWKVVVALQEVSVPRPAPLHTSGEK